MHQVIIANSEIAQHSEQFDFLVWALEQSRERFLPKVRDLYLDHPGCLLCVRLCVCVCACVCACVCVRARAF
jgi:hypothetical protein